MDVSYNFATDLQMPLVGVTPLAVTDLQAEPRWLMITIQLQSGGIMASALCKMPLLLNN